MKMAITGMIASGKSRLASLLRELGYDVFDCDKEVHHLYETDERLIRQIAALCGKEVLVNGQLHRPTLAQALFSNPTLKQQVQQLVFSRIYDIMEQQAKRQDVFIAEVPLLFETDWLDFFDEIILVECRQEVQLERLMTYRHYSKEEAIQRINHYPDLAAHRHKATMILENNGTEQAFLDKIKEMMKKLEISY